MTFFILACAGLLVFSAVFYLVPRGRKGDVEEDLESANLEWYRLRQAELAREGADALQDDARLRLLEDEQQAAAAAPAPSCSRISWVSLACPKCWSRRPWCGDGRCFGSTTICSSSGSTAGGSSTMVRSEVISR